MADVRSSGDMPPASTLARAASVHSPSPVVDDGDDPGVVVMHAARWTGLFVLLLQAFTSCWQRARPFAFGLLGPGAFDRHDVLLGRD